MNCRLFVFFVTAILIIMLSAAGAEAQTSPLTPGTVSAVQSVTCPTDFWSATGNPAVCFQAMMACTNTPNLSFTYGYDTPTSPKGTIVLFTDASGVIGRVGDIKNFAEDYYNAGYEVVEFGWNTDWEQTADPLGLMTAACRPAGFLAYALTNALLNARIGNPGAGFCAQGTSAGSGALGYSLAWYGDGGGNYLSADLDDVELISGPVFGNIQLGCQYPPPPNGSNVICPPGQYGCSVGTTTWLDGLQYTPNDAGPVGRWTNDLTCGGPVTTSSTSNAKWLAMSIVNGTGGNFSYPTTGLAGWLCASSTANSCAAPNCPNNSGAQGNVFFKQIASGLQAMNFKLTGITGCNGPENIESGTDPDPPYLTGKAAVEQRMKVQCTHPSPN